MYDCNFDYQLPADFVKEMLSKCFGLPGYTKIAYNVLCGGMKWQNQVIKRTELYILIN